MPTPINFPDGINCGSTFRCAPANLPECPRSKLTQDVLAVYHIPWYSWRVHDAIQTLLPGTSASDDLGLYGGTFATSSPSLKTVDQGALGSATFYARTMIWLPPEYDAAQTMVLRFHAGMLTTIADVAATLDAQMFKSNGETGIGSDLVSTSAINVNQTSLADRDFAIDSSGLLAGDWLDLRIAFLVNDAATVPEVRGIIGEAKYLLDIRG